MFDPGASYEGLKFLTRSLRNLHREDLRAIRTKFTPRNGSGAALRPSREGCTTDKSDFRETWRTQSHHRRIFSGDEAQDGYTERQPCPGRCADQRSSREENLSRDSRYFLPLSLFLRVTYTFLSLSLSLCFYIIFNMLRTSWKHTKKSPNLTGNGDEWIHYHIIEHNLLVPTLIHQNPILQHTSSIWYLFSRDRQYIPSHWADRLPVDLPASLRRREISYISSRVRRLSEIYLPRANLRTPAPCKGSHVSARGRTSYSPRTLFLCHFLSARARSCAPVCGLISVGRNFAIQYAGTARRDARQERTCTQGNAILPRSSHQQRWMGEEGTGYGKRGWVATKGWLPRWLMRKGSCVS